MGKLLTRASDLPPYKRPSEPMEVLAVIPSFHLILVVSGDIRWE